MKVRVTPMMNNEVEIEMPYELQSNDFPDEFLQIQDMLDSQYKEVLVVFKNVVWIDNLAIMYLLILLKKLKENGKKIKFDLTVDIDTVEQVRYVKYLYDYGFLDAMEKLSNQNLKSNMLKSFEGQGYQGLKEADFAASECLVPFEFLVEAGEIQDFINKTSAIFHDTFFYEISENERMDFEFKISVFLQEVLGNVFEHAYDKGEKTGCGVMIRYLHRPDDNGKDKERIYYSLEANPEASLPFRGSKFTLRNHEQVAQNYNPYRNKKGIQNLIKYLQIFVVDAGKGILGSMEETDRKKEKDLINEVFERGRRTRKKRETAKNTDVGGLGMLYRLLKENGNYISVKGEYNWARIHCGQKPDTQDTLPNVHNNHWGKVLKGFSVIGYMDCNYEKSDKFIRPSYELIDLAYKRTHWLKRIENYERISVLDLRFDMAELKSFDFETTALYCFVSQNLGKDIITKEIVEKYEGTGQASKNNKTLFLIDIPERELKKYELIFQNMRGNIKRIVLLSQGLKVAVYVQEQGKLLYSKTETQQYINNCLLEFLEMIRYIESCTFWKLLKDEQERNKVSLFINDNVGWNYPNGEKMEGYLDFSQICFNLRLKEMLIYQIRRISNVVCEEYYFQSIDRFTEELCESANGRLQIAYMSKGKKKINIGSVYVTGTSSKDIKLKIDSRDEEYYYFVRDKNKKNEIKALLLWPEKTVTNKLFEVNGHNFKYERFGHTPFLAPEGNVYFMKKHYDDDESICLKPDTRYHILQDDRIWVSRLGKIAHFDMIDHHDYIYLNGISVIGKSRMESGRTGYFRESSSYDFLLKNMYIALGKAKAKDNRAAVEKDITAAYRDVVMGKVRMEDIPDSPGVFVYLTDYETAEIVSMFREIFSAEVNQRIIPIAPINRKRSNAALLISPLLMEDIRSKLEEIESEYSGKKRVTIFICTVSSTKMQRELKHILHKLGADEVKCISLIDRQRFPLGSREKGSYFSFSKWDLPEMGIEDTCKVCQGIKHIEQLSRILLTSEMRKRCGEICSIWGSVKVAGNNYGMGVDAKPLQLSEKLSSEIRVICQKCNIPLIEISTDIGLVLFAVENTVITMSSFFVKICCEDSELEDDVKILLISAYLLLFKEEEISEKEKYSFAKKIYELLQKQKESNTYTALAVVVLLAQKGIIKGELHEHYKKYWTTNRFNNMDFIIASVGIMYGVDKNEKNQELNYWIQEENVENIDYLYGIFNYTESGIKTRHGTMLLKLTSIGDYFGALDYLSAYNDVEFLEKAYSIMPHSYFANPNAILPKKEEIISELKTIKNILRSGMDENIHFEEREALEKHISKMLKLAGNFNKMLFMNTEESLNELSEELENLVKESGINCCVKNICYENDDETKYFCFMEDLRRELSYLIKDVRYSNKDLSIQGEDGNTYAGILEVQFKEDFMIYRVSNYTRDEFDLEYVKKRKKIKFNRPSILSLRTMMDKENKEKLFDFIWDQNTKLYTAEIKIPYLHIQRRPTMNSQ